MDLFYIVVASVAIVLLIIILAFIGIGMKSNSAKAGTWPPIESTCPDYWTPNVTTPNYCKIPETGMRNTGSIYTTAGVVDPLFKNSTIKYDSAKGIDFTDSYYTACNKQKWAKKWGVYWDGYSNYNGCDAVTK